MTDMRRITVSIPDEVDRKIINLRKTEGFERCTYSEIVRQIVLRGLEKVAEEQKGASA